MKKTLSLILALLMSASCAATLVAADEAEAIAAIPEDAVVEEEAAPVEEDETYKLALQFLDKYDILQGKEDGLLHAEDQIKRYEMAIIAGRVSTGWVKNSDWLNGEDNSSQFDDLAGTAAEDFYGVISYAAEKGIIVGYDDGTFKPEKGITYREALTMATRTLGYKTLEWPWGYIEKAVSLGLTDGITGVAYTAEVNRGVIAQIVYNMLFATTSTGDTLAMRSFDVDFGWQNIIVTADVQNAFVKGAETTAKDGIVAFVVLNNDGTLDDTTYYVKNSDLELGRVYNALFEINAKDEFVNLVGAYPYSAEIVENKGLTDDEGDKYEVADKISAYLKPYSLVDQYDSKVLSSKNFYNDEMILVDMTEGTTKTTLGANKTYGIDWANGNIVKYNATTKVWDIVWYWNEMFEVYYKIVSPTEADHGEVEEYIANGYRVGIKIMDEDDQKDLLKEIDAARATTTTVDGYKYLYATPAASAYASLEVYNLDGKGTDDYGIYEAYFFGKLEIGTADCQGDCKGKKAYKVTTYNLAGKAATATYFAEGACKHYDLDADGKAGEKYANAYALEAAEDYKGGYAILGVDATNNTIKVVKEITTLDKTTDVDTYVANGIVRGYSMGGKTVTIDNEKMSFDYDTLSGNTFLKVSDNKALFSDYFDGLFNQYVEYVVVDGKVVKIATEGGKSDDFIVVDSYAGIDSNGNIVINGYLTSTLKYDQYVIGTIDGWENGDIFFYEDQIRNEFTKGNVYQIVSYDKTNDIYYVNDMSLQDLTNGSEVDEDIVSIENATFTFTDNYRTITYGTTVETKRMNAADKYVIIGDGTADFWLNDYMPILVFEGKVPSDRGWAINGADILVKKDNLWILANVDSAPGFILDTRETGYVVVLDSKITDRNYNGYGEDYYIYGATQYTMEVFNLLTAKTDEVRVATNLKVEEGMVYTTITNTVTDNVRFTNGSEFGKFMRDMTFAYSDVDADTADYLYSLFKFDADNFTKTVTSSEIVHDLIFGTDNTNNYTDLVDSYTVLGVELDADGLLIEDISAFDKDDYADLVEDSNITALNAFIVYNVAGEDAVVYVLLDDPADTKVEGTVDVTSSNAIQVGTDAYIQAVVGTSVVTEVVDGVTTTTTKITDIGFKFTGKGVQDTHAQIADHGYFFGYKGECDAEKWNTTIQVGDATPYDYYGSIAEGTYDPHVDAFDEKETICKLVNEIGMDITDITLTPATDSARSIVYITVKFDAWGSATENMDDCEFTIAVETDTTGAILATRGVRFSKTAAQKFMNTWVGDKSGNLIETIPTTPSVVG